ncbi:transcriptional regulator Spx [Lentilactobacillus buchneri]|nr:transcriptional regulator Spx [Lentilactobacillus sp. Egmn17]
MLNLYVAQSSASSRKARAWLKSHHIDFKERNINSNPLNADEVKRSNIYKKLNLDLDNLTVSQLVDLVVKYPDLIKRPIIFDDHRLEVGFNEEEIRRFLPRSVREAELRELESQIS